MRIYCDFDGTITCSDTTDQVLERFAAKEWLAIEDDWVAGRLTAAECMRAQVALIDTDEASLNALLDSLAIRPGFAEFAAWASEQHIPLTIVSDGVDYFINRILRRHGLAHIPIFSNRLTRPGEGFGLEQPLARQGCAAGSGVCKCDIVAAQPPGDVIVFVGDGRSDFCVSNRADFLFARDKLAAYADARGQPYLPYTDFFDVRRVLSEHRIGAVSANG